LADKKNTDYKLMEYIFRYENWQAFELMRPTHGDCDSKAKNCPVNIKVVSVKIGSGNRSEGLKREVTGICPVCKDKVHFWVVFDKFDL
jgi:hypothetical protein